MTNKFFTDKYINSLVDCYNHKGNLKDLIISLCRIENINFSESLRTECYRSINKKLGKNKTKIITEETFPSAWNSNKNQYYSLEEYCSKYNIDIKTVKSASLSGPVNKRNYTFRFHTPEETGLEDIMFNLEKTIKKHIKPVVTGLLPSSRNKIKKDFDRLVYTDVHIGMDVNGFNKTPLYKGKWDKEEVLKRLDVVVNHVIKEQESDILFIDDLGDYLDGLNKQTTRGGHSLPQNMTDNEVYDLGVLFKVSLVEKLLPYYNKIVCNSIIDDNHSGLFSSFVNKTVKHILELKHPNSVEYNIIKEFMGHYSVYNHTFVLCHGKDSTEMSFGFKPVLDSKQIEKIDHYIKENKLYNGNYIEFSKGDSHQGMFDETTSNDFFYYSYPAFSEPSNWVKTNFKNTISGFRFFSFDKNNKAGVHKPFYFQK